jgi:hypothetical protein
MAQAIIKMGKRRNAPLGGRATGQLGQHSVACLLHFLSFSAILSVLQASYSVEVEMCELLSENEMTVACFMVLLQHSAERE